MVDGSWHNNTQDSVREQLNQRGVHLGAAAGDQKCFETLLSAGYKFLFLMDNVKKICTWEVRKKTSWRVLEKKTRTIKILCRQWTITLLEGEKIMYKKDCLSLGKSNLQSETFNSSVVWCVLGDICMKIPSLRRIRNYTLGISRPDYGYAYVRYINHNWHMRPMYGKLPQ